MVSMISSEKKKKLIKGDRKEWLERESEKERDGRKRLATKRRKTTDRQMDEEEEKEKMKRRQSEGRSSSPALGGSLQSASVPEYSV